MICSAMELGLGEDHSGIIVLEEWLGDNPDVVAGLKPGQDAIELLGLADEVVEVNVTPDRGYCFSLRGIAREYALSTGVAFRDPADPAAVAVPEANDMPSTSPTVRLGPPGLRPLHRAGGAWRQRPRGDAVVDAEAAHPGRDASHLARCRHHQLRDDAARPAAARLRPRHLSGSIGVRRARAGETLTTLDDVERTLDPEDLLIIDGSDTPLAVAGVMGGASSEVTDATTNVLIEAAHFDPTTVARSSRRHRLTTEASKRFERGVDPAVTAAAAQLAVDLLVTLGGGAADPGHGRRPPRRPRAVRLRPRTADPLRRTGVPARGGPGHPGRHRLRGHRGRRARAGAAPDVAP